MKQEIFNTYAKKLCELFSLHEEDLFSKTKKRACVDARHLLYYVCHKRPMRIRYIQDYMANKGYNISHSSVIHGINQVSEKVENDSYYYDLIDNLKNV